MVKKKKRQWTAFNIMYLAEGQKYTWVVLSTLDKVSSENNNINLQIYNTVGSMAEDFI